MPARVIRAKINRSDSLSRVSLEAELFFRTLLLAVDDYGRLDARIPILKAECVPLREEFTEERIREILFELCTCDPGGGGPVRRYDVAGQPYLHLPNWELYRSNSKRAAFSKYPEPPEDGEAAEQLDFEAERRRRVAQEIDQALSTRRARGSPGRPRAVPGIRGDPQKSARLTSDV